MSTAPGILARGPWPTDRVSATWSEETYVPPAEHEAAADAAIQALRERDSPSHDGVAARLQSFTEADGTIAFQLQPVRWALRLVEGDASGSIASLCITRDAQGRWLAGRRAAWLSSWAGRWALGAGGAVDLGENPADTLARELWEEWAVEPERVHGDALVRLPQNLVMFIGTAWLPDGAEITMDPEHDAYAWWPADIDAWPDEADAPLRYMAKLLTEG